MDEFVYFSFFALVPVVLLGLALLAVAAVFAGLTYLVPRRLWPWLLLVGCPLLALGPVATALLLDRL